jgi:molybdopterin-synthase adenylyltransferase
MPRIIFCGVGALGSNTAVLCRNLSADFTLIDFDRVETKNLSAQGYVKQSVGKNKAEALKLQLLNFWGKKADAAGVRLAENNVDALCGPADLLVDCFDNYKSRLLLSEHARRAGKPLVHGALAADGTFGIVRWDERFTPDAEDEEGQATCEGGEHLPVIGLCAATLARVIQDFMKDGTRRDAMISLQAVVSATF